jgi:hypothetical protein
MREETQLWLQKRLKKQLNKNNSLYDFMLIQILLFVALLVQD